MIIHRSSSSAPKAFIVIFSLIIITCYHDCFCSSWMIMSNGGPPNRFPASTRQALLDKAKELSSSTSQQYSTIGWSNRCGTVLTPAAIPGVYTGDRPFLWNNIDVGCRMTVVELPPLKNNNNDKNNSSIEKPDLWIHSPVALDGPMQEALKELGTVRHVVSPNYEHLKFAPQWALAYPDATMWGCPGLMEKTTRIYDREIPTEISPSSDELWPGIQSLHITTDTVPILQKAFFNEVVFYHSASKSLIATDFYWNYPANDGIPNSNPADSWELAPTVESIPFGTKVWKFAMNQLYAPFYRSFMITSEGEYQNLCNIILKEWDITTIIPAHGDILRGTRSTLSQLLGDFFKV